MKIGGIIDISTKDIPGRATMVIFMIGCNFGCEFCHNKELLQINAGKDYSISKIINQIKSNLLVSGVSITGGEPTLQDDLIDLAREIKKIEKYLSIDTNGSRPEIISNLVHYVDRIALDLKSPLNQKRYKEISKCSININKVKSTIQLINQYTNIDFEIRTTYVKNLLTPYDIKKIFENLRNLDFRGNFVLQQYQYSEGVGEKYKNKFQQPTHGMLITLLKPYSQMDLNFEIFLRDETVGYSKIKDLFDMKIDDLV